MNTNRTFFILLFLLFQPTNEALAQAGYRIGGLPSLNLNWKLKSDWSLNTKVEARQLFQQVEFRGTTQKNYQYILTDFSFIAAKKVGLNARIGAGYLIRFEGNEYTHRFLQQYTQVQKFAGFRLAHRVLSDQTFSNSEQTEVRLRYRITAELPLSGEVVDPGEFYLKLSNEYVSSWQKAQYGLEIRLIPILGYSWIEKVNIESGLDYRVESFLENETQHNYWMTLNVFIEVP